MEKCVCRHLWCNSNKGRYLDEEQILPQWNSQCSMFLIDYDKQMSSAMKCDAGYILPQFYTDCVPRSTRCMAVSNSGTLPEARSVAIVLTLALMPYPQAGLCILSVAHVPSIQEEESFDLGDVFANFVLAKQALLVQNGELCQHWHQPESDAPDPER